MPLFVRKLKAYILCWQNDSLHRSNYSSRNTSAHMSFLDVVKVPYNYYVIEQQSSEPTLTRSGSSKSIVEEVMEQMIEK